MSEQGESVYRGKPHKSEITLYDLRESQVGSQEVDLDFLLAAYKLEDRRYLIVDRAKGRVIDTRVTNADADAYFQPKVPEDSAKLGECVPLPRKSKCKSVWDNEWKELQKMHQKFLQAICRNNQSSFFYFLDRKQNHKPININYRFQSNWTPLHYSAMHSSIQIFSRLINHPDINIHTVTAFGQSALHIAVKNNKADNCELLIGAGIDVNLQDNDLCTALHYATEMGSARIVQLLTTNEAKLQLKNSKGETAADICSCSDLLKFLQPDKKQEKENPLYRNRNIHRKGVQKLLNRFNSEEKHKQQGEKTVELVHTVKQPVNGTRRKNILKLYEVIKQKSHVDPITLSLFRFYKKIGEGAFGEVYLVKKNKSEKLYALKAIRKERVFGTSLYRYIQTEKEVLSLINHPFIVRLHFAFQTEAYLFLVMDYCEGGDLSKVLSKKKRFEEKVVKLYANEILLAMEVLHANKIIYRDLKPENIVLDRDGHVLLTDFGLSKKTADIHDMTQSFCGTPAYLPLEIINKKGHNFMADWYEFGIVLYELLTGFTPFYAETKTELYNVVREGIIRFPRNTPELFRDLIKKLLCPNPQKRLGFEDDAQSIKEHPWFADVDWQAVLEKRQVMPPIQNKMKIGDPIRTKFFDGKSEKFQIPLWSFIS